MCGILGVVDWRDAPLDVSLLGKATNLLRHRGPDAGACWTERGVYFGHRRLSIIDLTSGAQPMASGDGRVVVIFNGEIYNYRELREELTSRGVRLRTTSDTEALVEGYRLWGADVVTRLEGMFAVAVWDRLTRELFVARDRFGEKPLLIARGAGRVAFASELAPLAALGMAGRDVDLDALGGYLCFNYVPGTRTLLAGVERLPPATWRRYRADGSVEEQRYWRAADAPAIDGRASEGELLEQLQARLDRAVAFTLRSDVPVGLFLSGGVDSALVAESAARQGHLARAFCVDYAEAAFSEAARAQHVADRTGVPLERVPLDAGALARVDALASHLDDPLADSSAAAVWCVAEAAARHVKVVLSGDGGDELFGGYLSYASTFLHQRVTALLPGPARWLAGGLAAAMRVRPGATQPGFDEKVRRLLRSLPLETREAHFTWNGGWAPREASGLVATAQAREATRRALAAVAATHLGTRPSLRDLQTADASEYLPNDILAKVDRATMAHGLESRAPFLDRELAGFGLGLPDAWKTTSRARTKVLLRRLCARHFGEAHAQAPKQGFTIPLQHWLRHEGRGTLTAMLDRDRVRATGLLDETAVAGAVADHLSGRRVLGWELWALMVLVSWWEQRVLRPPDLAALPEAGLTQVTLPAMPQSQA